MAHIISQELDEATASAWYAQAAPAAHGARPRLTRGGTCALACVRARMPGVPLWQAEAAAAAKAVSAELQAQVDRLERDLSLESVGVLSCNDDAPRAHQAGAHRPGAPIPECGAGFVG